ncbi:unnamed protein product [Acanthoscelides obtectus]|uniref:DUF7802 domain-containing protein n=1 Tax=Acanthoscelides obtectus TaxID=200917 RepID=A0A9P0LIP5_ACAOB|nr:unnamed protein product [Acanthoscelides obtectus]CAK1650079.1 hypothetical protein AOBTE_LOCUS16588 [Acanthoscelides obtectus]
MNETTNEFYENLFTPGTALSELKFDGFCDWFVRLSDVSVHWEYQPSYVLSQCSYLLGGLITFIHACNHGGRLPYLWLTTILHGLAVESISYIHPDIDNFWHSQTFLIFLGRRLPLHIIVLYPVFIYNSSIAAAKARLSKWSEPFAVGLLVVLIDIAYDIVSVNFLHWTWHDTDPNIYDRHYWVPWNSYYFHATFAASFTFWFHFTREVFCESDGKWLADKRIVRELLSSFITALLGPIGGILMFLPLYHPLHDMYNIHSEVTYSVLFVVFLLIVWTGDRGARSKFAGDSANHKVSWATWLIVLHLVCHYATFLYIVSFFNPEDEISTGLKEPLGPCDKYVPVQTVLGMVSTAVISDIKVTLDNFWRG